MDGVGQFSRLNHLQTIGGHTHFRAAYKALLTGSTSKQFFLN